MINGKVKGKSSKKKQNKKILNIPGFVDFCQFYRGKYTTRVEIILESTVYRYDLYGMSIPASVYAV